MTPGTAIFTPFAGVYSPLEGKRTGDLQPPDNHFFVSNMTFVIPILNSDIHIYIYF